MSIQWAWLVPAVGLLWVVFPLFGTGPSEGESHSRLVERPSVGGMLRAWRNILDLVRACAGAFLLQEAFTLPAIATPVEEDTQTLFWIKVAILAFGLGIQMVRFPDGFAICAPAFYLAGLTPILSGPVSGLFSVGFALVFAASARDGRWFLPVLGPMILVTSYIVQGLDPWILLNVGLIGLPYLISFSVGRMPLLLSRLPKPVIPALTKSPDFPQFVRSHEPTHETTTPSKPA